MGLGWGGQCQTPRLHVQCVSDRSESGVMIDAPWRISTTLGRTDGKIFKRQSSYVIISLAHLGVGPDPRGSAVHAAADRAPARTGDPIGSDRREIRKRKNNDSGQRSSPPPATPSS